MATRNSDGKTLNQRVQRHPDGSKDFWRDIPGYVGYYRVSDRGRVKTVTRVVHYPDGRKRTVFGKVSKIHSERGDNARTYVNLNKGNRTKRVRVCDGLR